MRQRLMCCVISCLRERERERERERAGGRAGGRGYAGGRRRRRRRKIYSGAKAVNEEDCERDRATQVWKTCSAVLRS